MPLEYMLTFPIIFYTKSYQNNNATPQQIFGDMRKRCMRWAYIISTLYFIINGVHIKIKKSIEIKSNSTITRKDSNLLINKTPKF